MRESSLQVSDQLPAMHVIPLGFERLVKLLILSFPTAAIHGDAVVTSSSRSKDLAIDRSMVAHRYIGSSMLGQARPTRRHQHCCPFPFA